MFRVSYLIQKKLEYTYIYIFFSCDQTFSYFDYKFFMFSVRPNYRYSEVIHPEKRFSFFNTFPGNRFSNWKI